MTRQYGASMPNTLNKNSLSFILCRLPRMMKTYDSDQGCVEEGGGGERTEGKQTFSTRNR